MPGLKENKMLENPVLFHCAYHKCLTVYTKRVFQALFNRALLSCGGGYRHFRSDLDAFYENLARYRVLSLNNCFPDLNRLGDFRMTRFIRDPRDLLVSGYYYHRKCNEKWVDIPDPEDEGLREVNGHVPPGLKAGESYRDYLGRLSLEDGLIAEIQFRKHHFDSMMKWPVQHPQIRVFRYEDIIGHEKEVFRKVFEFYGLSKILVRAGCFFAGRYAFKPGKPGHRHIRDPRAGQWQKHFTDSVSACLEECHPGLLSFLGYE